MDEGCRPLSIKLQFMHWSFVFRGQSQMLHDVRTKQESLRRKCTRVFDLYSTRLIQIEYNNQTQVNKIIKIAKRLTRILDIIEVYQKEIDDLETLVRSSQRKKNLAEDNLYC